MLKKILIAGMVFVFAWVVLADADVIATTESKMQYCPVARALLKSDPPKNIWYAPGGWRSYDPSFAHSIKNFIGVQWQGTAVGHITCLYMTTDQLTFPIQLNYNQLVYEPRNYAWRKNRGGFRNCVSHDVQQCPFAVYTKESTGDVYQQAQQLRQQRSDSELAF